MDQLELCPWALREGVILRRLDLLAQGLGTGRHRAGHKKPDTESRTHGTCDTGARRDAGPGHGAPARCVGPLVVAAWA